MEYKLYAHGTGPSPFCEGLLGEGNPVQTGGQFNGTGLVQETGHLADKLTTT